jgi:spore coat polysaccharide biosynthesis protein SpsF (cytidylyltransferase family)
LYNFKYIKDLSNWRWTVDEKKDIEFIKRVFKNFKNNFLVDYEKVIKWIIKNNLISKMNFSIPRNFGYKKSKKKDQNI